MFDHQRLSLSRPFLVRAASFIVFIGVLGTIATATMATPPLRVSSDKRSLIQSDGKPFFWMGDTNWRLMKLTQTQVKFYLDRRRGQSFNVIQGPVLLSEGSFYDRWNAYGEDNTNPAQPNEAWFQHIDYIVNQADLRGMYMALVTVWGSDWPLFNSPDAAYNYGWYLGNRYKNKNNVIWIVAGEYLVAGDSQNIIDIWDALGEGLHAGSEGRQLITIHAAHSWGRQSSSVYFHDADWLDFNMIQSSQSGNDNSGADNWNLVADDYSLSPVKPTLDGEPHYEGLGGWDAFGTRRRAYWAVFAGGLGHTYGSAAVCISYRGGNDVNDVGAPNTWVQAMEDTGANDMRWLRRLIESRPMLNRVPYPKVVVGSLGGVPHHIEATRDTDRRFAMIYVPQRNRTFTVKMSKIAGNTAKCWWYDARNGKATYIGAYASSGTRTFITPNSGQDWVLVLDDKDEQFPAPGIGGPLK